MGNYPIIFFHQGASDYLRYTIDSARIFNRHARVIVLGDKSNEWLGMLGVEHFPIARYSDSTPQRAFTEAYESFVRRYIPPDTEMAWHAKLCIDRWFVLEEFLKRHRIESCWFFDSDTLILADLGQFTSWFDDVDATALNNRSLLNGFIRNRDILSSFGEMNTNLFSGDSLAELQREETRAYKRIVSDNSTFAFLRDSGKFRIADLDAVRNGMRFDGAIKHSHGMEMSSQGVKSIYLADGLLLSRQTGTGNFVQNITLNMSWTPTALVAHLFFAATCYQTSGTQAPGVVEISAH